MLYTVRAEEQHAEHEFALPGWRIKKLARVRDRRDEVHQDRWGIEDDCSSSLLLENFTEVQVSLRVSLPFGLELNHRHRVLKQVLDHTVKFSLLQHHELLGNDLHTLLTCDVIQAHAAAGSLYLSKRGRRELEHVSPPRTRQLAVKTRRRPRNRLHLLRVIFPSCCNCNCKHQDRFVAIGVHRVEQVVCLREAIDDDLVLDFTKNMSLRLPIQR
mmetsp:Transcript_14306/g.48927  ORF Transcript_14306/g.48927 Transcript_14306/m.48927 type:complete len:214 (-) Transcript_14306:1115-1756(-)